MAYLPSNKLRVRVALDEAVPYIIYDELTMQWKGVLVEVLEAVCSYLGFRCEYFNPTYDGLEDETMDGVMGAITNATAESGLAAVGISVSRYQYFSFIDSFFRRSYMIAIHQDHLVELPASEFIRHTTTVMISDNVWFGIAGVIIVVFVLGVLTDAFQKTLQHEAPVNIPRLILKWCFQMFGMGIGVQGIEDFEPVQLQAWPTAKIILLSTWFAYTFVILNTISSQLPVMFAFDNPKQLPFNDVKGLLDSDFVVYGTSTAADMLKLSIGEHHAELSTRVRHMPIAPPGENRYDHYNHIAKAEKSVLIINQETLLEMSFRNCEMFVAIDNLVETRVSALLMLKNSSLRESFERGYAKATQNGVAQFAIDNYEHYMRTKSRVRTHGQCYRRTVQTKPNARVRAIHLQQMYFLFGWLVCGLCGCFGILLIECIVFLFMKKKCWFRLCRRLGIFTFTYTVNQP